MTLSSGYLGRLIAPLARTVSARHRASERAGGARLARAVLGRHRHASVLESVTRLSRARTRATDRRVFRAPVEPVAPGMSDFTARWLFGDGPAEGIPFATGAAQSLLGEVSGRPTFLESQGAEEERVAAAGVARRVQPVPRGRVEEVGTPFRLSSRAPDAEGQPIARAAESDDQGFERVEAPAADLSGLPTPDAAAGASPTAQRAELATEEVEFAAADADADKPLTPLASEQPARQASPAPETPRAAVPVRRARRPRESASPTVGSRLELHRRTVAEPKPSPSPAPAPGDSAVTRFVRRLTRAVRGRNESVDGEAPVSAPTLPPHTPELDPPFRAQQQTPAPASARAPTVAPPASPPLARLAAAEEASHSEGSEPSPDPPALPDPPLERGSGPGLGAAPWAIAHQGASEPAPSSEARGPAAPSASAGRGQPASAAAAAQAPVPVRMPVPLRIAARESSGPAATEPPTTARPLARLGAWLSRTSRRVGSAAEATASGGDAPGREPGVPVARLRTDVIQAGREALEPEPVGMPVAMTSTLSPPLARAARPRGVGRPGPGHIVQRAAAGQRPRPVVQPTSIQPRPTSAPQAPSGRVNGSPGLRLAQQTGAGFSTVDGTETVLFPWPSEAQPQAASSFLFREPAVEPPAEATAAAQPSASAAAPAAAPTPPPQPPSAQPIDEIYEQVVGRLRRDLLAERERMGDLLGDLP